MHFHADLGDIEEERSPPNPRKRLFSGVNSANDLTAGPPGIAELGNASLEQVLTALAPSCFETACARFREEGIETSSDLAMLDVPDLRQLLQDIGLRIIERGRMLRWAAWKAEQVSQKPRHQANSRRSFIQRLGSGGLVSDPSPGSFSLPGTPARSSSVVTLQGLLLQSGADSPKSRSSLERSKTLDELEENAEFWCQLIGSSEMAPLRRDFIPPRTAGSGPLFSEDFRENVIEDLFDLNPERLREVYDSVDRDSDGRIRLDELREALHKCGITGLDNALDKVLKVMSGSDDLSLELSEFESMLTRLKLAQLLTTLYTSSDMKSVAKQVTVTDYNPQKVKQFTLEEHLQPFFFGHRDATYPIRWVHLGSFELTIFLALTVKYQLHPLSVEDVIHQSLSKVDRYGEHYFVSIEHLHLRDARNGQGVVEVQGRHVTIFAAGPPYFDTIITVAQPDRSFNKDWPGGSRSPEPKSSCCDVWMEKLQKRLKAVRSRARERQADYLMYAIIDLCADDLLAVTRAFSARLTEREDKLRMRRLASEQEKQDWFEEVGRIRLQIAVVSRRLRGLKQIVRRLRDDEDMLMVHAYLADVADHLTDAYEDAVHLHERAQHLMDAYEHAEDQEDQRKQQDAQRQQAEWQTLQTLQDERMNRTLFILTVSTTLFTPLTFITGVYGMNFVNEDGKPTIPELLNPQGYSYFKIFVAMYLVLAMVAVYWIYRRLKGMQRQVLGAAANSLRQLTNRRSMRDGSGDYEEGSSYVMMMSP